MSEDAIHIHCRRDKRFKFRRGRSEWVGLLNRGKRCVIEDIPLLGMRTLVHIEYAQVFINKGRIENNAKAMNQMVNVLNISGNQGAY